MSEPTKKPLVILGIILTPPAAVGGLFLGAMLFTRWQALKTPASIGLLPRYLAHTHQMSPAMHTAFVVSCVLAGIITLTPALMMLIAALMKPKRELHGSARFANRAEIYQAGLLNKPKPEKPADKKNQKQIAQADYPETKLIYGRDDDTPINSPTFRHLTENLFAHLADCLAALDPD